MSWIGRGREYSKFYDWEEERQCFLKQFLPPQQFPPSHLIHPLWRRIPTHILPPPSSALQLFSNSPFVIVTEIEFEDRNVGAIFITIIRNDIAGAAYLLSEGIMKVYFNGGVWCGVDNTRSQRCSFLFIRYPIKAVSPFPQCMSSVISLHSPRRQLELFIRIHTNISPGLCCCWWCQYFHFASSSSRLSACLDNIE